MSAGPRVSFCSFTVPHTTFEEDVALAAKHGFEGFSVAELKLGDAKSDESRARVLRESGLRASACIPYSISPLPLDPPGRFSGETDLSKRRRGVQASVERLAKFGAYSVVLTTGKVPGLEPPEDRDLAVQGLRDAARVASEHGTRISVEALRLTHYTDVRTLPTLIELIDEIGEPNVDAAYDIWHLWDQSDNFASLAEFADRIGTVHVSDWLGVPGARPTDRGFAGEGVANVSEIIATLESGGFSGWYDVEVFSSTFEGMDPDEIYRRARESWDRTWDEAAGSA